MPKLMLVGLAPGTPVRPVPFKAVKDETGRPLIFRLAVSRPTTVLGVKLRFTVQLAPTASTSPEEQVPPATKAKSEANAPVNPQ